MMEIITVIKTTNPFIKKFVASILLDH